MPDQAAVFIDFENLRYGVLNRSGEEPDFHALVQKVTQYGRPRPIRAYADFSEHPPDVGRRLQIAGIEAISVPTKRNTYTQEGRTIERIKNAVDMVLALDAVNEAWETESTGQRKVFLLVTGDRDYVKLVTLLRHRFGHKVVIVGVPGQVSPDLVEAAGHSDLLEIPLRAPVNLRDVKKKIVAMVRNGVNPPPEFWSFKLIAELARDSSHSVPGTSRDCRDALTELETEGVFVRGTREYRRRQVTEARLIEDKGRELGYID